MACADVCNQMTAGKAVFCDTVSTAALSTPSSISKALAQIFPCRPQYIAACPYFGGAQITAAGFCQFASASTSLDSCPRSYVDSTGMTPSPAAPITTADPCFTAVAATNKPVCVCSSNGQLQLPDPFPRPAGVRRRLMNHASNPREAASDRSSASSTRGSSLLRVLLAAIGCIGLGILRHASVLGLVVSVLIVTMLLPGVSAHNFVTTPKRSVVASVTVPCEDRIGNQPQLQLVAGQEFPHAWSTGHGDDYAGFAHYFVGQCRR